MDAVGAASDNSRMEVLALLLAAWVLLGPLLVLARVAVLSGKQRELEDEVRALRAQLRRVHPTDDPTAAAVASDLARRRTSEPPLAPQIRDVEGGADEDTTHDAAQRAFDAAREADAAPVPSAAREAPRVALAPATAPTAPDAGQGSVAPPLPQDLASRAEDPGFDWERWLGVRGAAVVGGVAVTLAGLFFVQLAIQRGWIGPAMRDGLAVGVGALALAAFRPLVRRGFAPQASALGGAGTVLVYLGAWAAGRLHGLAPMWVALIVMAGTTAVAGRLALGAKAQVLAAFAVIGGFATPVLLEVGARSTGALFVYLGLLNVGAQLAAARSGWRWLGRVTFAGTLLVQLHWYVPALVRGGPSSEGHVAMLAALGGMALVHLVTVGTIRRAAGVEDTRGARPAPTSLVAAVVVQALFMAHLGRTSAVDASLVPVAVVAAVVAVAAAVFARGFGAPALSFAGGLGGVAVLGAWAVWHPARAGGAPEAYTRLLAEFGGGASLLAFALWVVERDWRRARSAAAEAEPTPSAARTTLTSAMSATGLLVVLAACVGERGGDAPVWLVAGVAATLASLGVLAAPASAAEALALVLGGLAAIALGATLAPARAATLFQGVPLEDQAATALIALVSLGALAAAAARRATLAAVGAAAVSMFAIIVSGVGAGVGGEQPLALAALGAAGALAAALGSRSREQRGEAPVLTAHGLLALAALAVTTLWSVQAAQREGLVPASSVAALVGLAAAVALAGVTARGSLSGTPVAWLTAAPAIAAFLPAVRVLEFRSGVAGITPFVFLLALLPTAAAGLAALWTGSRALAAPRFAVAATLAAFAAGHAMRVHPALVGLGLGATACGLIARSTRRADVQSFATALALLGAFSFLGVGIGGLTFQREASLFAPRLALVAGATAAGLIAARGTLWPKAHGLALLAVTFLWLNLVVLSHYGAGATIRFEAIRAPARDLVMSLVWAIYAAALLTGGQLRRSPALRWASLAFFLATVLKVFLFDLGALRGGYRAASFLGLGVALFGVSAVYQRWVLPRAKVTRT